MMNRYTNIQQLRYIQYAMRHPRTVQVSKIPTQKIAVNDDDKINIDSYKTTINDMFVTLEIRTRIEKKHPQYYLEFSNNTKNKTLPEHGSFAAINPKTDDEYYMLKQIHVTMKILNNRQR